MNEQETIKLGVFISGCVGFIGDQLWDLATYLHLVPHNLGYSFNPLLAFLCLLWFLRDAEEPIRNVNYGVTHRDKRLPPPTVKGCSHQDYLVEMLARHG